MFGSFKNTPYLCTRNRENDAPVAQLVEHLTLNQGVQGSSPCGCTKEGERNVHLSFFCIILRLHQPILSHSPLWSPSIFASPFIAVTNTNVQATTHHIRQHSAQQGTVVSLMKKILPTLTGQQDVKYDSYRKFI